MNKSEFKTLIVQTNLLDDVVSKDEIIGLAETAGLFIDKIIHQNIKSPNVATFIGTGKVEEIKELVEKEEYKIVIFDSELSPSQQSNLEDEMHVKVIDRTALILDIFAKRANTREGKIQVELAQLDYMLPRLKGKGIELSKLAGGIGIRGPGESKLETDRRKIKDRIIKLKNDLKDIEKQRKLHRNLRKRTNIPHIAIVGYTNAGKSTLINLLTSAESFTEDKLFATLDTTTRKLALSNGKKSIITDTVGFIDRLPHHLVEAFKSTFEEIKEADLILHVIDLSNPSFHKQTLTVHSVLENMGIINIPRINIYNKIDIADVSKDTFLKHPKQLPFVMMSAAKGEGKEELLKKIEEYLSNFWEIIEIRLEHVDPSIVSFLLANGNIIEQKQSKNKNIIRAELPKHLAYKVKKLILK